MKKAIVLSFLLSVAGLHAADTPPAPTVESLSQELAAAKQQLAEIQLAFQAVRSQRDAAVQAIQDQEARMAVEKAKAEQAKAPSPSKK